MIAPFSDLWELAQSLVHNAAARGLVTPDDDPA
jgi:hypothetical protein